MSRCFDLFGISSARSVLGPVKVVFKCGRYKIDHWYIYQLVVWSNGPTRVTSESTTPSCIYMLELRVVRKLICGFQPGQTVVFTTKTSWIQVLAKTPKRPKQLSMPATIRNSFIRIGPGKELSNMYALKKHRLQFRLKVDEFRSSHSIWKLKDDYNYLFGSQCSSLSVVYRLLRIWASLCSTKESHHLT